MNKIINPFAVSLNIARGRKTYNEVENVSGWRLVYRQGDYTIWKISKTFFNTCWKNVIITQTVGIPKILVNALCNNTDLEDYAPHYHLQRMKQAITDGVAYAKENNIEVINI